jgi:CDP-diglyceride synthetase
MTSLWRVVNLPELTPLKKTDYFSSSSNQFFIAPQLWVGLLAHFPIYWDFSWLGLA